MRYVVANRLSGAGERKAKRASADAAESILSAHADIKRDNKAGAEDKRRIYHVDCDAKEMARLRGEFEPDVLVEPYRRRDAALSRTPLVDLAIRQQGVTANDAGMGAALVIDVRADGRPAVGVKGLLVLQQLAGRGPGTRQETESDADGKLAFAYDPTTYVPALLTLEPPSCWWSLLLQAPQTGMTVDLRLLPKSGPDAWWRQLVGASDTNDKRGEGIRVATVDTGVGPHPYLKHVQGVGAIIGDTATMTAKAAQDVSGHGTHVAGLIGARPVEGSGDYQGVAPAAELGTIRVFASPEGAANQGDIAEAIDVLAIDFQADLINLSLGGPEPSQIERDALAAALELGALPIASAGNDSGAPVSYPAAYPEAVAVAALGLIGTAPPRTMASASRPQAPTHYTAGGLFVANFSNSGPELVGAAPGVGIISTVPARPEVAAPYAVMNGTSMAAPLATAALARVLSNDTYYRGLPRGASRMSRAAAVLAANLQWLGLPPTLAGGGLMAGLIPAPPTGD